MHVAPSRRSAAGLLFAVAVGITRPGLAQTSKGIIAGVARDTTGAAVARATVTVTNQGTSEKRTIQTGTDGAYRIDAV